MKTVIWIIVFFQSSFLFSNGFYIGANLGTNLPIGDFKDNSGIFSNCKDNSFGRVKDVKINNTDMAISFTYNLNLSYRIKDKYIFNLEYERTNFENDGIEVTYAKGYGNYEEKLKSYQTHPFYQVSVISLGFEYVLINLDKLEFTIGLQPNLYIIRYNSFGIKRVPPDPYIIEIDNNNNSYGFSGKIGINYRVLEDLLISFSSKYSIIYDDYNNGSLSVGYSCYPLSKYYVNPKYLSLLIGLKYNL